MLWAAGSSRSQLPGCSGRAEHQRVGAVGGDLELAVVDVAEQRAGEATVGRLPVDGERGVALLADASADAVGDIAPHSGEVVDRIGVVAPGSCGPATRCWRIGDAPDRLRRTAPMPPRGPGRRSGTPRPPRGHRRTGWRRARTSRGSRRGRRSDRRRRQWSVVLAACRVLQRWAAWRRQCRVSTGDAEPGGRR